jgi:hypothetical protein
MHPSHFDQGMAFKLVAQQCFHHQKYYDCNMLLSFMAPFNNSLGNGND